MTEPTGLPPSYGPSTVATCRCCSRPMVRLADRCRDCSRKLKRAKARLRAALKSEANALREATRERAAARVPILEAEVSRLRG